MAVRQFETAGHEHHVDDLVREAVVPYLNYTNPLNTRRLRPIGGLLNRQPNQVSQVEVGKGLVGLHERSLTAPATRHTQRGPLTTTICTMSRRWPLAALAPIFVVLAACSSTPQSAPTTTTTSKPGVHIILRTGPDCTGFVQWIDAHVSSLPAGTDEALAISCSGSALDSALRTLHLPAATVTVIGDLADYAAVGVCPTRPTLPLCRSMSKTVTATDPIG